MRRAPLPDEAAEAFRAMDRWSADRARELAEKIRFARRRYQQCAAIDPEDSTGYVSTIHDIYRKVFFLAARGSSRLSETEEVAFLPNPSPIARLRIWWNWKRDWKGRDYSWHEWVYFGRPEVPMSSLDIAKLRFSGYEYADKHIIDELKADLDQIGRMFPRGPEGGGPVDETYVDHRARIARRMKLFEPGVSEAIILSRPPTSPVAALPPRGRPRSLGNSGTRSPATSRTPGSSRRRQGARTPRSPPPSDASSA